MPTNMTKDEFCRLCAKLGLSRRELSVRLGVSLRSVQRWRTGTSRIPPPVILYLQGLAQQEAERHVA